jgi:hypothetical protein
LDKLEEKGGRGHEFIQQRLSDGSLLRASVLNVVGTPIIKVWINCPVIPTEVVLKKVEEKETFPRGFIFIPVRLDTFFYTDSVVSVGIADTPLVWSIFNGSFDEAVQGDSISWGYMIDEWSDPSPERCAWIVEFAKEAGADALPTTIRKWVKSDFGNCYWAGQDADQFDVLSWNDYLEPRSPEPAGGRLSWV